MSAEQDAEEVAAALYLSVGLFKRRLRQMPAEGELSLPESSALRRLERGGPATVTALARAEQISVQSMGATLSTLEARGLIERHPDPADGRRSVMSVTETGLAALSDKRNARIAQLARALAAGFTPAELGQLMAAAPLIERLAENV
ncbi:MAG TPA: MarR family transcriptional regulator [Streptosporangiaceae bacterium]|nr:MarR family transcriptional regulator [Streptosporangiaceae bacterium]HLN68675.1 MarR family transcriptional regulator [Streptosporangiaceae bacterium]